MVFYIILSSTSIARGTKTNKLRKFKCDESYKLIFCYGTIVNMRNVSAQQQFSFTAGWYATLAWNYMGDLKSPKKETNH